VSAGARDETTPSSPRAAARVRAHLGRLYPPDEADRATRELLELMAAHPADPARTAAGRRREEPFDETDVVLISYADQVFETGRAPLATMADFLDRHLGGAVTGLHLLPFYPSTSDDGFAVVDYGAVDPSYGDWADVELLGRRFRLMVDAVFNHMSASSAWFRGWLAGDPEFEDFFVVADRATDLSAVTRPRTTSLLTPFEVRVPDGAGGTTGRRREVWTTFSADQVDLNYANPRVLVRVTEALLGYLAHGAGVIRLDAVAFLWKEAGTSCVHLVETHEVIRLWRTVVDEVAPGTLLITETNVPHRENVSYFGDGTDEAHLVYQFPLAPLVLSMFLLADSDILQEWASTLATPSAQTTFLNFLGSHDGVGVRPAEGLLTPSEIQQLCDLSRAHGGGVSFRAEPDGRLTPYELNTVFFEALTPADSREPLTLQVDRYLAAQSILLALAGVPAVYVQGLFGGENWHEGVRATNRLRTINRRKWELRPLERELADPGSRRYQVFTRVRERIRARTAEPAFHPNGAQRILETGRTVFAIERDTVDGGHTVVCATNVAGRDNDWHATGLSVRGAVTDLLSGDVFEVDDDGAARIGLPPYGVRWLRGRGAGRVDLRG